MFGKDINFFSSSSFFNKKSPFIVLPSGMSAAMTASSASNHRQYFTCFGYSALHNSARCLPVEISQQIVTCRKNNCGRNDNNCYLV
jgi:hypothetical protein